MTEMHGILLTFDPLQGVQSQRVPEQEAYELARAFAKEHFPGIKTQEIHVLHSWWLSEDKEDGLPFFTPAPWPIAIFYPEELLPLAFPSVVPNWLAMLDTKGKFIMSAFSDRESLDAYIARADLSGCRIDETAYGGITITWYPLTLKGGEPQIVGYGFRFLFD